MLKTGSLIGAVAAAALMLSGVGAEAQFFPFFQPQQQQRPQPAPQSQPQARPAERTQPAPARRTPQPAQKSQAVAPKPGPAPKAAPATAAAPYGEVRTACATEIKGTCAGVAPGSAESVQCLRPNFNVLSPQCQAAVTRAAETMDQAAAATAPEPKSDTPAGTADAPRRVSTDRITQPEGLKESAAPDLKLPAMRPTQEARWVNRNCKEDHSLLCQGVTFGQSRVLRCLLNHHSSLKADCRKALAKR